jgi:hypothetical protein
MFAESGKSPKNSPGFLLDCLAGVFGKETALSELKVQICVFARLHAALADQPVKDVITRADGASGEQ